MEGTKYIFLLAILGRPGMYHNLHVMHVDENLCDNVVGTLLDIDGNPNIISILMEAYIGDALIR